MSEDDFDVDQAVADIKETVTKPGDIICLGHHRLMCGDATNLANVEKLMDGKLASMVFTDPPYNVDYTGGTKNKLKIWNDNMPAGEFNVFLRDAFVNMFTFTEPGGAIYVCHADTESGNVRGALQDAGWSLKQCLTWVKNQLGLQNMFGVQMPGNGELTANCSETVARILRAGGRQVLPDQAADSVTPMALMRALN